ncbi:SDR family NAD(P)-dependent oxidoreductase [Streptomyces justiciae]|uniref:SDR family NAD(P)-dependent oxidoreductase n=1 Tax=Streptomyces justiciae TaxID=2780140 RepID=UPI001882988D|nr:SDR family NAD(P)-dependent oxidoreductase [Streptomyces justiciae]MBE8476096.1 SDR family NAD(P)-dependent oxidoreductase [Streptomyces justiciae]
MPTIAVVGTGPGLGLSIARVFGGHGFDVALVSRTRENLDGLVAELTKDGITAEGFQADVSAPEQLTGALAAATERFGRIDVLEYSPQPSSIMSTPAEVTLDTLRPQIDGLLYGAVTAVQAVLPDMRKSGSGTLLFTTGGGAIDPHPALAALNIAHAALRNWAVNLHNTLGAEGIYAANVSINVAIAEQAPQAGIPYRAPDEIAQDYWTLHTCRETADHFVGA